MPTSSSAPGDGAMPDLDEPRVRAMRGPPPGRSGEPAEVMLRLAQEHDRIAVGMNDIVVYRLFSAGLCLQTALGLMDGHLPPGRFRKRSASWTWRSRTSGTCCSTTINPVRPPAGSRARTDRVPPAAVRAVPCRFPARRPAGLVGG